MFESEWVFLIWLRFIITREECFQSTCLMHPSPPGFYMHWCSVMPTWNMTCLCVFSMHAETRRMEVDGERTFVCPSAHRVCRVSCQGGLEDFILISSLLQLGLGEWYTVLQLRTGFFFFFPPSPLDAQMTTSQQEVHGIDCKDSGEGLGQCWVRLVEFDCLKAPLLELWVVETL